jgi:hypothetical protein
VVDHFHVPDVLQIIPRAIRGEIVDQDDFLFNLDLFDGGEDPVDIISLVVDRDDDRKLDLLLRLFKFAAFKNDHG